MHVYPAWLAKKILELETSFGNALVTVTVLPFLLVNVLEV